MNSISRRKFLKLGSAGLASFCLGNISNGQAYLPDFQTAPRLGRVFAKMDIKTKPNMESPTINTLFDDATLVIEKEVIGEQVNSYYKKRTWYQTPEGYVPAISVQPCQNLPNQPIIELPQFGDAPGFWAEVTIPYVDLSLDGGPPKSPTLAEIAKPRFYYSQVLWIDGLQISSDGTVLYHVIERHGSYGDEFWADARAFKPIFPEEILSINPDIENKSIIVNINNQTLSCYENDREILFTRISSGAKFDYQGNPVEKWSTPVGDYHAINRKFISLHMAGGEAAKASAFEQFAVPWTSIFASGGVAIHSTYWHNNYGELLSHGCVNVEPEVAKFVYRWSLPQAPYDPGRIEIDGYSGTNVKVKEGDSNF